VFSTAVTATEGGKPGNTSPSAEQGICTWNDSGAKADASPVTCLVNSRTPGSKLLVAVTVTAARRRRRPSRPDPLEARTDANPRAPGIHDVDTGSMTGTTIKLDPRTRDRLRKQAGAAGRTLREHIEHLIVAEDRRLRMDALGAAVAATPADRMSEYSAETAVWESAELTDARRA
jgi:hypothetical protein